MYAHQRQWTTKWNSWIFLKRIFFSLSNFPTVTSVGFLVHVRKTPYTCLASFLWLLAVASENPQISNVCRDCSSSITDLNVFNLRGKCRHNSPKDRDSSIRSMKCVLLNPTKYTHTHTHTVFPAFLHFCNPAFNALIRLTVSPSWYLDPNLARVRDIPNLISNEGLA